MSIKTLRAPSMLLGLTLATLMAATTQAQVLVNDSWADGDLAKTGALDSNWWTSTSGSGDEVGVDANGAGFMGLVTGSSGRGLHTVFPTQTLNVGEQLTAHFTFTTPDTIGRGKAGALRFGLFDNLGRDTTGVTRADGSVQTLNEAVSASSGSPNEVYGWAAATPAVAGLPGYMLTFDVGVPTDATVPQPVIKIRKNDTAAATGRGMSTTSGVPLLAGSTEPESYDFAPNTSYTGSFSASRLNATEMELTGTMGASTFSTIDTFESASFGMFAIHNNSNTFGTNNSEGETDNGLDFTNVTIERSVVPEPSAMSLLFVAMLGLGLTRKRK